MKMFAKLAAGAASVLAAGSALAIDTAAIGTSLTSAQTDALAVGELVVGVVAALIVVGLVIGMVRKI